MSLDMYWRRPPVDADRRGGVGHPTKGIVIGAMTHGLSDGSLRERGLLNKDSAAYHYLRGVMDTHPDDDVRADLADLLAVVDKYGAAEVWTQ